MLTTWTESGIVSGRVALLPRSVEVRPGFFTFPPRTVRTEAAYAFPHFSRPSPYKNSAQFLRWPLPPSRPRSITAPPRRAAPSGHRAPGPEGTPAGGARPRSETPSAPSSARGRTAYTT